jgi:AhpD family alkylhydroperoxidase
MSKRLDYHSLAAAGIKALGAVSAYGDNCGIEPTLRPLVELRVSQINGCSYCLDLHVRRLRELGEKQQRSSSLVSRRQPDCMGVELREKRASHCFAPVENGKTRRVG